MEKMGCGQDVDIYDLIEKHTEIFRLWNDAMEDMSR
jgi:hypothetical protein